MVIGNNFKFITGYFVNGSGIIVFSHVFKYKKTKSHFRNGSFIML